MIPCDTRICAHTGETPMLVGPPHPRQVERHRLLEEFPRRLVARVRLPAHDQRRNRAQRPVRPAPPRRRVGHERPRPPRLPQREPVREMRPGRKPENERLPRFHPRSPHGLRQCRLDLRPAPLLRIVIPLLPLQLLQARLKRRGQQDQPALVRKPAPPPVQHRAPRPIAARHQ